MKNIALTTLVLLAFAQVSQAASIAVTSASVAGGTAYAFTLNAPQSEIFNGVQFSVIPASPAEFVNLKNGGLADAPLSNNTFISGLLALPVDLGLGGYGWTLPGKVNTATLQSLEGGPLGSDIDASAGIFLSNVVLPAGGGTFRVVLGSSGNNSEPITGTFGSIIPEPSSIALAGLSLIGLVLRRRNG